MPVINSSVPGFKVRPLKVHEMRDLNRNRKGDANDDEVSFRIAAMSILGEDGKSIGEAALAQLEWPHFQLLLRDVLRANGMQSNEPEDEPGNAQPAPPIPGTVTPEQPAPTPTPATKPEPSTSPAPDGENSGTSNVTFA